MSGVRGVRRNGRTYEGRKAGTVGGEQGVRGKGWEGAPRSPLVTSPH